ncbi:MAG: SRPBCC domain-containing protein [Rhodospirillaceae bacterium]|jgi:uncharacterized protein YndB with AHSA1/START domain|nr:SRPBCC domain-containing protein [Rhodospirillaceae bacterium]MBT5941285.1 SRPBCC domain-containing protein [Rhodospirillaceae bacterium]MBT7267602.1 SRPBCC domain-containing protein [Rhodospirillaceae bacterium]
MEQVQTNETGTAKDNSVMAPDSVTPIELKIERTFDASPEMVFDAWVERDQVAQWYGPEGMAVPLCEMDSTIGGSYRVCFQEPDGTDHIVVGSFKEIDRPNRLVFTWGWEEDGVVGQVTEVSVEFAANGDKTDLTLTHRGFETEDGMNGHKMGWTSSFESLAKLLAA